MKTSTIKECEFIKSFTGKYGELFSHRIIFENGDEGQINAKTKNPEKFEEGKELTYNITPNDNPKFLARIKSVNPKYPDNNNSSPKSSQIDSAEVSRLDGRIDKVEQIIKALREQNKLIYNEVKDDLPF